MAATLRALVTGEVATTIEDAEGDAYDVRVRLRSDSAAGEDLARWTICA